MSGFRLVRLVPKLHLGTHLSPKLCFAGSLTPPKCNFARIRVTKLNLVTRFLNEFLMGLK